MSFFAIFLGFSLLCFYCSKDVGGWGGEKRGSIFIWTSKVDSRIKRYQSFGKKRESFWKKNFQGKIRNEELDNEELEMKNEKWRMRNEEWEMKNEKWRVRNEELEMKNEKWRMRNEELIIA